MLQADVFAHNRQHFAILAQGWLEAGALAFAVWMYGEPWACWPKHNNQQADLTAPLLLGGSAIGELRVVGLKSREFEQRLLSEARLLSHTLETQIELDLMTSEMIDMQDQLLALYDLSASTRGQIGISETLRTLASELARLLRVEAVAVFMMPTLVHYPRPLISDGVLMSYFQQMQASGGELLLTDVDSLDGIYLLPIQISKGAAGLALMNKQMGQFTTPDLKLARAIADQAAAQIERALLHQEMVMQTRFQTEMELARQVQIQLLPQKRPQLPTFDIYAESRPALLVGGDFYEFIHYQDRPFTIAVGDVAGKGISAAMITGMIHTSAGSAARYMPQPQPSTILRRVNEDLYDDFTNIGSFATVFVGQFEADKQILRYANAGHAPVILCKRGQPAYMLEADNVPLGVLPIEFYEDSTIEFESGDLLVITSDGINEAMNTRGKFFTYERILELVDEWRDEPPQVIAYGIFSAVDDFSAGEPQADDQTIVIIKGVNRVEQS